MKPLKLYELLFKEFGPQNWWPAETPFEVIVGAVLTQNTSWKNVEKAIANLKRRRLLTPSRLAKAPLQETKTAIRPVGYYNQKAARVKAIARYLAKHYGNNLTRFLNQPACALRYEVAAWKGVGPETRDSILLYAAGKPVFVVDAYTVRVSKRLGLTNRKGYADLQDFFESALPRDAKLYNEFHALLVELGKNHCLKTKPKCEQCPLTRACPKKGLKA